MAFVTYVIYKTLNVSCGYLDETCELIISPRVAITPITTMLKIAYSKWMRKHV